MSFTTLDTMRFVGTVLESSFYGLYCVAFAVHARIRSKKKGGGTNIAIYPLSVLFTLCTIFCAIDTAQTLFILRYEGSMDPGVGLTSYNMNMANTALYCSITFVAQGILIYRCWILWGRSILAIVTPLVLAFLSFGASLAILGALAEPSFMRVPDVSKSWYVQIGTAAFSASIGVNAILAILLASRLFVIHRESQRSVIQKGRVGPIRAMIAILNESGMLMLGCQILWLVLFRRQNENFAFFLVRGPIVMIYGLTPTLILQRIQQQSGQTSTNEKPAADRSTTIRFAL